MFFQHEVGFDITMYGSESRSREIFGSYGELPVARAAVLKHALRSMHRMMQSSGTAEGLRGLIDTSLLQSIKRIMEYRGLFGPSVLPLGGPFKAYEQTMRLTTFFSDEYHGDICAQ